MWMRKCGQRTKDGGLGMCDGTTTRLGSHKGGSGCSGTHTVDITVRYKNCNGKNNQNDKQNMSIG